MIRNRSDRVQISFVRQPKGGLAASYFHWSGLNSEVRVAIRKSGVWTDYEVDGSKGAGTHLDAVFTPSGASVIAYYEERGHSLKLFVGE